jgi:AsmA-like C-terminal region
LCLLLLFWVALALYVEKKKDSLLEKARAEISARLGGTLRIGHLDISLLRNFPAVSLQLKDVSLRDSAWEGHHHDLLHAGGVYVSCSVLRSLFHARIELSTVSVEHATIYFYTDSTGYSNTYLFKSRSDSNRSDEKRKAAALPDIVFSDVRWVVDMQDRHKLFDLQFQRLNAAIDQDDRTLRFDINTALTTKSFAFNTEKGSFVREKPLSGHFGFTYNTASRIVQIDRARLQVDGYWFIFSGRFFPTVKPDPFFLTIDAEAIPFRKATALLTSSLEEKLDVYDIDKPVAIHAQLDAGAADQHEPQIQVRVNLDHGGVLTPTGRITDASFRASFTNEWVHGRPREDENSGMRFTGFSGQLDGIPLRADTVVITNLKHPQMACDLHSQFGLDALNAVYGSETLQFGKGSCRMDLRYNGPLSENDTAGATVNGHLDIDSAAIVYLPYQFQLTHANGRILFRDQDMVIEHLEARAGNTRFRIKGVAKNLISLIDHNAENVSMDWTLSAAHLALEDFLSLAGRSSAASARRGSNSLFDATASRIDRFLKDGLIHVHLDAADISYANFAGAHAKADLSFQDGEMRLSRMTVDQSAGSLDLKGTLLRRGEGNGNPLTLESHVEGVDLPGLFRSFDNFGLKAITANNLKGRMSADIKMSGLLTNKAQVVQNSLKGTVAFRITDGQLVDFEPMEKIHEKVLKKRDLSEIHFGTLENELDIDSTTVTLHRMEIQSTAITLYAEGTYDLKKGADMSLQIPLNNLKARDGDIPPESRGNDSKGGLSLHLRAKTGEDGKLKISWDPFRKALKKGKKA